MYKGLFGIKHKLANVNIQDFTKVTYQQTGFKDSDILCAECDNGVIGNFERYACNYLYNGHDSIETETFPGDAIHVPFVRYKNLDYAKIKLFFLTILWKSHLSQNPFFQDVNLGTVYGERLRKMILDNDAGAEDEFEVILIKIANNETKPIQSIIQPRRLKDNGNTTYVYHINEIMYHFNISNYNKMSMFDKGIIKKDGIIDIAIIENDFGNEYFDSFVGQSFFLNNNKMDK
ncbi:hypothetical protein [Flavobacterium aquiphilum]|uniref:hypothetical protein n=1 Tax=Flavobacterium aquiphilum TaxID=3003261 RepID=UPI00247FDC9C|nr:hypothetical protein [Flavobacterium aquiphilum]